MTDRCRRHCAGPDTAYTAGFRAGLQQAAYDTYADNIFCEGCATCYGWPGGPPCAGPKPRKATRETVRVSPFEGVTVIRWADDEPHIIRGTE